MPFLAASASEIRDRALENWRTRYLLLGRDLDITPGSHAYNEIDALSFELATLGLGAQEAAHRVLLRYAQGEDLDAFAEDDGTARLPASTGRFTVTVTGPASATTSTAGAVLSAAGGARYRPVTTAGVALTAIDTDGDGAVPITVEAEEAGATPNLAAGTILTWSSAPTGFSPLATVTAVVRLGEDAEGDADLRQRLLDRRRERPASGNRADWREWARVVAGVGDCFVHCAALKPDLTASPARPTITADRLGCMTLLPLNPAPAADTYAQAADGTLGLGLSPSYSRVPSGALCTLVEGYIDGTLDREGTEVAEAARVQLYPGPMARENWGAVPAEASPTDVVIGIKVEPNVWVFADARVVQAGSTTTAVNLDVGFGVVTGTAIAVELPAGHVRGNFFLTKVTNLAGNTVTVSPALPVAPSAGAEVRHDPGAWSAVLAAALGYFDSLGPGTTSGRSQRFPPISWGASDRFSPSQLLARVIVAPSLTDATIYLPLAASTAALGYLATPGKIIVQRYA